MSDRIFNAQGVVVEDFTPPESKKRERPVCTACGGHNIRRDAYADWSDEGQCWELVTTFDNTDCEDCGGECEIEWKEIEPSDHKHVGTGQCPVCKHYGQDCEGRL